MLGQLAELALRGRPPPAKLVELARRGAGFVGLAPALLVELGQVELDHLPMSVDQTGEAFDRDPWTARSGRHAATPRPVP